MANLNYQIHYLQVYFWWDFDVMVWDGDTLPEVLLLK